MLEGKIQIDLHNHNSGFTERYEQKNMITNAVKYMTGNVLNMRQNPYNLFLPLSTYGLGGILLFDGSLTESAENIHFPSDVHLVGHAGQSQDTSHPLRGSIDTLESGPTETGYKNVWDFNTSQANGTIASLALTNRQAGDFPFEFATGTSLMANNFMALPVAYDDTHRMLYYRKENHIYKTRIPNEKILVHDPFYGFTKDGADEMVCTIELSKSNFNYWEVMNGYDGYMYVMYAPSNSSGDAKLYVRRYKVSDFSFDEGPEQEITLRNVALSGGYTYTSHTALMASKGYYYLRGYDSHKFYIVEIANTANVRQVDFGDAYYNGNLRNSYSGGVSMLLTEPTETGTITVAIFLYPDGRFVNDHEYRGFSGSCMLESEHLVGFHFYTGYGNHAELIMTPWYLGSICNLSSPVLKTPSTDMKITYTLTDIQEV